MLRMYGAEIHHSPGREGSNGAVAMALAMADAERSCYMPYQYGNPANPGAHYHGTARGIVTNKTPFGGYRGYGNPQSVFTMERMIDLLARHLGLDPAEVRLRNMI